MLSCLAVTLAFASGTVSAPAQTSGYVYVSNFESNNISGYSINDTTGALVPVPGSPFPIGTGPDGVEFLAVDPSSRFLYATSILGINALGSISAYNIDPATGTLIPILGSPFQTNPFFDAIIVDSTGRFLYGGRSGIAQYKIDSATGALSLGSTVPFATLDPSSLASSPDGRFLAAANFQSSNVSVYAIDSTTGALTQAPGSPFPLPASVSDPFAIVIHPAGRFAYVSGLVFSQGPGAVVGYSINPATGALTAIPGAVTATGSGPFSTAVSPSGNFLYVGNRDSKSISAYRIDELTGILASVPGSPFAAVSPDGIAVDPTGRFVYASNLSGPTVSAYAIAPATGALTPIIGAPSSSSFNLVSAIAVAKVIAPLPLGINGITPSRGGNAGTVTPHIIGQNFQQGAQVKLTAPGQSDIVGVNTVVPNGFQLTTTFGLPGAAPGIRSVVVTNPDNSTAVSPPIFVVEAGGSPDLSIEVIGRPVFRSGAGSQTFYVNYGNQGTIDSGPAMISIAFPKALGFSLGFGNNSNQIVSSGADGSQSVISVSIASISAGSKTSLPITLTFSASQPAFDIDAEIRSAQ
jgi:6-phosphogluconolactonase (cycloisomerase 2 family)